PLHPGAVHEASPGRPRVAARATLPSLKPGGRRDLARGATRIPLPADDGQRLPAPPRFVDLSRGDELGGAGINTGRAGRVRIGQARDRTTHAPSSKAEG